MVLHNQSENKIIDFEDIYTYPQVILHLLSHFSGFKKIFHEAENNGNDYELAVENFINRGESTVFEDLDYFKMAMVDLAENLRDWSFIAYHITRVIDPNEIKENGLKVLNCSEYIKRMCSVFRSCLGYTIDETKEYLKCLNYTIHIEPVRENNLSFFAPASKYILHERDGGYITLYGSIIGGEVAKKSFEGYCSKVHKALSEKGATFIVKARLRIRDLIPSNKEFYELSPKDRESKDLLGFFCFLFYLASQLYYNKKLNYNAFITGQVFSDVAPNDIINVDQVKT